MRRLICENKNAVKKYNSHTIELCRFHNINRKLDDIKRNWHAIDDNTRAIKIDLLDE